MSWGMCLRAAGWIVASTVLVVIVLDASIPHGIVWARP